MATSTSEPFSVTLSWAGEKDSLGRRYGILRSIRSISRKVKLLNEELPNIERVRNFVLCHHDWTTESGELTTTLKPVRQTLLDHYQKEIEKIYA